jgi:AcrR family transcriptional regulator
MIERRRRGAVRNEATRVAILRATASQFAERGWDRLTIEGIAAEAGVGKATIYRWWSSRSALVAECLLEGLLLPEPPLPGDTGDVRADLAVWLDEILRFAAEPRPAELFRSLVAAAAEDEQVAFRLREAIGTPDALAARLDAARASGQFSPDAAPQVILDILIGVTLSQIITRAPAVPGLGRRLVGIILK